MNYDKAFAILDSMACNNPRHNHFLRQPDTQFYRKILIRAGII